MAPPTEPLPLPELSRPFDVVIAGAGLAGSALAIRLATAGVRVALVDSARFPRDKLCGEFLSPEAWGTLAELGLADDVARSGYRPVRRIRLTTPRGRVLDAELAGLPGIGLGRSVLDDLLVQRARRAGAVVIEGARVACPIIEEGRVRGVTACRMGGRGESFDIAATVTVAADGRHSSLLKRTGTTRTRSWLRPRLFGMKRHLFVPDAVAEPDGTVGLHLLPGGYGGVCRIEGRLTNLCALLPESALRSSRGRLDRLADDQFARNPALGRVWTSCQPLGEWKCVAGVRVEWSMPRLPGLFYAGDCQGTIDPLGGQGMTMALLGSEVLAPFVRASLVAHADSPALQRAYSRAWHDRFDRRITLCRAFHHLLVNPWAIDLASTFKRLAPRLLAAGFEQTREPHSAPARPLSLSGSEAPRKPAPSPSGRGPG